MGTSRIFYPVKIEVDCSLHVFFAFRRGGFDSLRDTFVATKISVAQIGTFAFNILKTVGNRTSYNMVPTKAASSTAS